MPVAGRYTGDATDYLGLEVAVQIVKVSKDATLLDPGAISTRDGW